MRLVLLLASDAMNMKEWVYRIWVWGTRKHPTPVAIVLTTMVAALDYATGTELRLFPIYFIPLALVAGAGSKVHSIGAAVALSTVWAASNYHSGAGPIYYANVVSQLMAFLVVAALVNGLKEQAELQRRLASTDSLTGLLNPRAFYGASSRELAVQKRRGTPLTMAYLDVDNFKKINSDLGHLGADDVLRDTAQAMQKALRNTDLIGRMGGDEFAIVLPDTGEEPARVVLQRLQKAVLEATRGRKTAVTVSIGAVVFNSPAESINIMMEQSDQLMYVVKRASKDDIEIRSSKELPFGAAVAT